MMSFTRLFSKGVAHIEEHPQLLMTLLLIVVIPAAFIMSGQQFLNAARSNQERLELDRIGMMQDLFAGLMRAASFDPLRIQSEIESLAAVNPDITKFHVAREEGGSVRLIASLASDEINTVSENPNSYRIGNTNPEETIITPYAHKGIRYWQSFRLVQDSAYPDHYIFIETSLEHIDTLFAKRILNAYYWLAALLFLILLLILRHVRLIDYSYLYKETKRANEMKDLFTNMIAHELRAPLTAMRGFASMIREKNEIDDESKKYATEIESASSRLLVIVNDLLDVARIQAGKMSIDVDTIHLSGVVRSVIEALHPMADEKGISLKIEDPTGSCTGFGDEKRIYQALVNIVSNAIKYTEEGVITIALTSLRDRVEIRVKDTGMGISSKDQQKLFAPFFRAEGSEMSAITGTGLGMWITKQLIERMDGSIGVESIKGVGTHVVITLPLKSQSGKKP